MINIKFKKAASLFFSQRASTIEGIPTLEDLCYVSAKETRLWTNPLIYDDLISCITTQLQLSPSQSLLEVGCAAGFLANGLAEKVDRYLGVDISEVAISVAKRLQLANATFQYGDAEKLFFDSNSFDRVICYDVFNNFPSVDYASKMLTEMWRVLKPNGQMMIGCIPESSGDIDIQAKLHQELQKKLDSQFGVVVKPKKEENFLTKLQLWYYKKIKKIEPQIVCYTFQKSDFQDFGDKLDASTKILDIHPLNPFFGYRFNVIYTKSI
jgi:ubiquinone/menaquinone biosynthesis C-methylase UbiE